MGKVFEKKESNIVRVIKNKCNWKEVELIIWQYFINFTILISSYGLFLNKSYNSDSIAHTIAPHGDTTAKVNAARYLTALLDELLLKFGFNAGIESDIAGLITIILFTITLVLIQTIFINEFKLDTVTKKCVFISITSISLVNVMATELFMFIDFAMYYGLACLFSVLAVKPLIRGQYIRGFLLFLISACFYQSAIVIGIIIFTAYLFLHNNGQLTINIFKEEIMGIVCLACAGFVNLFSIKLLEYLGILRQVVKETNIGNILVKLENILGYQILLLKDSAGLLPSIWLPAIMIFVSILIVSIVLLCKKETLNWLYFLLVCITMNSFIYIFAMVMEGANYPPRLMFSFYTVQSMIFLIAYKYIDKKKLLGVFFVGYFLIQVVCCQRIVAEHFASNAMEETEVKMIYDKIKYYEESTDYTIKTFAIGRDDNCQQSYEFVSFSSYNIGKKTYYEKWGDLNLIMHITGRHFDKMPMTEDMEKEYFENKNWDYFDINEQLIFDEDIAYWMIY